MGIDIHMLYSLACKLCTAQTRHGAAAQHAQLESGLDQASHLPAQLSFLLCSCSSRSRGLPRKKKRLKKLSSPFVLASRLAPEVASLSISLTNTHASLKDGRLVAVRGLVVLADGALEVADVLLLLGAVLLVPDEAEDDGDDALGAAAIG